MIDGPTVMIALINGMIGGVILVLPLLALEAGTIVTAIVIIISGVFSYYSSMLCVKHLGNSSDLDQALLYHFNKSKFISIFYDLIVFLNIAFLLLLYFNLITQQWEGILANTNILNPIINAFVLFIMVFIMKYFDLGASLLAYGIVSIVGYCIFLIWLLASSPKGNNIMQTVGEGGIQMAASMGTAFSIQTFFIPILKKNKNPQNYQFYTFIAYLIGGSIYLYIAYAGSFGILQRKPEYQNPQTIQQYFQHGHWQVFSLQILYLIHLYSVFPEFLLIGKKRIFNAFNIKHAEVGEIPYKEIIFSVLLIGICLVVSLTKIEVDAIIEVNGAVVGFFFIYFLPLIMHIKCVYYDPYQLSKTQNQSSQIQITPIQTAKVKSSSSQGNIQYHNDSESSVNQKLLQIKDLMSGSEGFKCNACPPQELYLKILDWIMLVGMMSVGIFIMYGGLRSVFS